jgi:hypothetical protein
MAESKRVWPLCAPDAGCLWQPGFLSHLCASLTFFVQHSAVQKKVRSNTDLISFLSIPLIARFTACLQFLAQAGTFHLSGVAVTSQILCISITLNKGYYAHYLLVSSI